MAERYFYKDLLPFGAMVTMEVINVALNTLFKAASMRGMSYHVFVVYSYAVAAILLLPAPFISRRLRFQNYSIFNCGHLDRMATSYSMHVLRFFYN